MSFKKASQEPFDPDNDGDNPDLLQCMICFEPFKEPKMLNCAHTFCSECLEDYQASYANQKRAVPGQIPCPNCRELTQWPSNGAAGLRTDFKVQQIEDLLKTMTTQVQNVTSSLNFCSSCQAQSKKTQAQSYCMDCQKSYCSTCMDKHSKNTLFVNHKVVTVSKSSTNDKKEVHCKHHPVEICKYLCRACDTMVCTLCLMNDHNKHEAVELKEAIKDQLKTVTNLLASVNEKRTEVADSLKSLEPVVTQCQRSCDEAEKAIVSKSEKLIADIKRKEAELLNRIKLTRDKKLIMLQRELDQKKSTLSKIKGIEKLMKSSTLTPSKLFKLYELLIQRMGTIVEVDSHCDIRRLESSAVILRFTPSSNEISTLGQLTEARAKPHVPSTSNPAPGSKNTKSSFEKHISRTAQKEPVRNCLTVTTDIKSVSPSGIRIPRDVTEPILMLEINKHGSQIGELNGPLWVASIADSKFVVSEQGNKRLQIFGGDGKPVQVISHNSFQPLGVSVTSKKNIITADGSQKHVEVFAPDGKILSKWGNGKFFSPCGIAVSPNGNIIVSDVGDNTVSVFKNESNCAYRLGISSLIDLQFSGPTYVTAGPHNEVIVSDAKNNCVKIFDSKGEFIIKIGCEGSKEGEFRSPAGVCTNVDGYLLVADHENDRISMLTRNGVFIRHVLTAEHGLKFPRDICFTPKQKLIVTESGPKHSAVKIFDVQL